MLCFIQSENRVYFFEVILLFGYVFLEKSKVLELPKAMVLFMDQHLDR